MSYRGIGCRGVASYVMQNQSRGIGAIAAHDLGATRVDADMDVPPPVRNYNKPPPSRTGPTLIYSRMKRGAPPQVFVPGKIGPKLPPPSREVTFRPLRPARSHPPTKSPVTGTAEPLSVEEPQKFVSYPPVTYPAGLLPGRGAEFYPDELLDELVIDEPPLAPAPAPKKKVSPLLIGGGIVGAGLLAWYLLRGR